MSNSLRFPSSAAISNHEGVQVCSSRILHFRDLTPFFAFVPTSFNNIPCSISTKWFIRELKRLFTCFVILRWRTKVPALEGNDEEYTSNRNRKPFWFLLSGSFLRQPSWRRSESDCFQSTSRIDIDWYRLRRIKRRMHRYTWHSRLSCLHVNVHVSRTRTPIHSFDSAKSIDPMCFLYIRSQRQIDLRKLVSFWCIGVVLWLSAMSVVCCVLLAVAFCSVGQWSVGQWVGAFGAFEEYFEKKKQNETWVFYYVISSVCRYLFRCAPNHLAYHYISNSELSKLWHSSHFDFSGQLFWSTTNNTTIWLQSTIHNTVLVPAQHASLAPYHIRVLPQGELITNCSEYGTH